MAKRKPQREARRPSLQSVSRPSSLLLHCYHHKSKADRELSHTIKRKPEKNAAIYTALDTV
jgi:hypothetical protein